MPLSNAVITYNISDLGLVDFDYRRTKVWATTNISGGAVIDTAGDQIRLGTAKGTLAADGTGSITVPIPGTGSNPVTWQTTIHVDYPNGRERCVRHFGPFTITASGDLADLVPQQEIPAEYLTTVTTQLGTYVTSAAASASAAAASASAAASVANIATPDALVASLVTNPASSTHAALATALAPYALTANSPAYRTLDDWAATGTGHYLHGVSSTNGLNLDPAGTMLGVENAIVSHPGDVVMIDLDYRKTVDGALASLHDATTVNVSDVTVTAADTAFRDLPDIYKPILYGTGHARQAVNSIESILVQARGRCVFSIEIKDGLPAVSEAVGLGARLGMLDKIVWNSGDPAVISAIVAAGGRAFMFNCNTTAKLDQAKAAGAWMVDVPTDATTGFIDYAVSKGFARILRGFINTAGTPVVTDAFSQVAGLDARLSGYSSDATAYLDRPGGVNARSAKSIAGMVRTGKRAPGLRIVNSSSITDWLVPTRLYTYKAGAMVYTFGSLAGTNATTGTLTLKTVFDTLPTTLTQSTRLKAFSPTEAPANASANTVEGYVLGVQADGVVFLNSTPVGGGSPAAVFGNVITPALAAGGVATVTLEWDDTTPATKKVRVTRQDATATLSGAVTAGTVTSLPVNALTVALANAAKLLLPDGTLVTVNGAHAIGATTLTVQSVTVAAQASGAALRSTSGWVTEGTQASWRGMYHSAYTTQTTGVGALTDLSIA